MSDQEEMARKVMARAIRRLNILEFLILGAAAGLAVLGGAILAWLLAVTFEAPFRLSWLVASIFFFGVPGAMVYGRELLSAGPNERDSNETKGCADGG